VELIIESILGAGQLVIGVVLGAIASWLVTYIYYRMNSREQRALFKKLPTEVCEALQQDPRHALRTDELMKILEELGTGPIDTARLTGKINGGSF
jgi:hypothetical protein